MESETKASTAWAVLLQQGCPVSLACTWGPCRDLHSAPVFVRPRSSHRRGATPALPRAPRDRKPAFREDRFHSQHLTEVEQRLAALEAAREQMARKLEQAEHERDEYRRVYLALLEAYRKLEAGLVGQKRERFVGTGPEEQLALSPLGMLASEGAAPTAGGAPAQVQQVEGHERKKPTGRKPLPELLPRIHVEVIPPEVQRLGLEAFERIGEDSSEVVEHRPSSLVVVHTVRPKFVPKGKLEQMAEEPIPPGTPEHVAVASTPVL